MKSILSSLIIPVLMCAWSVPAYAGLDIYAGPLAKFYKHDYLSTQAQLAKELGVEFNTIYPDGEPEWLTDKNADKKIRGFRKSIEDRNLKIGKWSEDGDEYLIEQLHWEGLSAIVYVAAYAIREDLERPSAFVGEYEDDPAYAESFEKGYYKGPLAILESDMFIPSDSASVIFHDDPLNTELMITTTHNLRMTLAYLNRNIWDGNAKPEVWFERGLANVGSVEEVHQNEETGELEMKVIEYPPIEDVALYNAEYAYGVLMKLLKYSETHNVPIAMDG